MDAVRAVVQQYWGYDTLRPLQHEAMQAALDGRDALTVLPTGGGKSLCYQAPALLADGLTVVISPLIALMKDQVDGLLARKIPAAFLNSSMDAADRQRVSRGIENGEFKLLFVAPERFRDRYFADQLERVNVHAFAIDEAHCISHWGHDFRLEYRQLNQLKTRFPHAGVHAFTATATPRVRDDIIQQLGLTDPQVLVGDFFRPNLTYRVAQRTRAFDDVTEVIDAHPNEAGIVYVIRRKDVDELTGTLQEKGVRAAGYHAGLSDEQRTRTQDAFAAGETDVVVATVAFGMGIDRSDIRFVIHAAMPKTIEHYQQETGRAGRDGQPAECVLFYSGADFQLWRRIATDEDAPNAEDQLELLREMYSYCTSAACRHQRLVTYFGQLWDRGSCEACDVCNGTITVLPDSTVLAQKIMSCIARTRERFGRAHIADVLRGEPTDKVLERQHNELSTFGLIPDEPRAALMAWMDQLVDQGLLAKESEYNVLKITGDGWRVLRDQAEAVLLPVRKARKTRDRKARTGRRSRATTTSIASAGANAPPSPRKDKPLDSDEKALFETLRETRRELATEQNVPAFMICSDRTLRDMARKKPTSDEGLLDVVGIGRAKVGSFGEVFLNAIRDHHPANS